ncbi:GEVED domain-containing protein [Spirosoma sp. RP8]|uniref:GEVED domain-containing protein n=1 Tax=Spirosoma liriopis TaxID=2937440 RepID=A0ABT0HHB8_9BACT|nr:GEVED domain-containing protein [Spirosoma liriopis]
MHFSVAQRAPLVLPPLCATPDLTEAQRHELSREAAFALSVKQASGEALTGIVYVPIRPHIFRSSNGTGGMTMTKLNNIIAITNSYYLLNGSGIQFYFCGTSPDYIDNDNLYNSFPAYSETSVNGRDATNAMNQYYVNAFDQSGLGGYAYFPGNSIQSTRSFILNESDEVDLANRLLPHEIGHNFNLYHTFGNSGSGTNELVTRGAGANCTTAGDELCDTPADPYGLPGATTVYINGCQTYNGTVTDSQGNRYAPSITNIMSYYFPCTHDFTEGQYNRMQAGLALRQTHTAYSLGCPATAVTAPSNVVAAISNGNVLLSWQDNGTNEMGYFIERSTSSNTGFVPIGGVGPNTSSYTDTKTAPVTTYYYRIRPSNSTTQGLSSVASVTTLACRPTYSAYACSENDGLDGFSLNGATLSQNSGCSAGGYSLVNASSALVQPGQSIPFTATLLPSQYSQGVSIWADLNRNGYFETDRNELLYQTPNTVTGQFSGNLALPNTLTAGTLMIRVVVTYNGIPTDACGIYSYGETEDYQITVAGQSQADLKLSMKSSARIPALNQPVSFSVTIQNNGPSNATGVSWQNNLPPNLTFVSGGAGVSGSGSAVGGSGISLNSGASATYVYQLRPTQAGAYVNAAQILTSDQPDPTSQPGSGTGDGQDDAANTDFRTSTSSSSIYVSPNPNQTPLPAPQSNQPAPVANKADLSMSMQVSNRTLRVSQPVTFTLTVANAGGLTATNIVVRDTLRNLTLTSTPAGMNVVAIGNGYSIVEGTISSLAAGATAQFVLTAQPTQVGNLMNAAQIWSAGTPDPDSTPGSVTPNANNLNGEDDVAWLDLRVSP